MENMIVDNAKVMSKGQFCFRQHLCLVKNSGI